MELGFIKARQRDGIERAKSKGDVKGRKPTIDRSTVRDLFNEGIGASEIARRLKIGRASVYRVLGTVARSLGLNSRISNATPMHSAIVSGRRCCASDRWRATSSVGSILDFGSENKT